MRKARRSTRLARVTGEWVTVLDPAGLTLTRGQQLVDSLIQAMIHRPTGSHSVEVCTDMLLKWIKKIKGDGTRPVTELRHAYRESFARPRYSLLLKRAARSRKKIEAYIEVLEITAGRRESIPRQVVSLKPKGYKSQGWSVCKNRQGTWRIALTSLEDGRPVSIRGSWKRREDARNAARAMIAKLRGEAA